MPGLTLRQIDRKTGIPGFGAALVAIGWILDDPQGVVIANFEEHNGTSAKKRAVTAKRVANHRSGNADQDGQPSASNADVTHLALQEDHASVTGALARERVREDISKEEELSLSPRATDKTDEAEFKPNDYGRICLAMKAAGIADTSPGNPEFRALVDAGADAEEFLSAAKDAVGRKKGFRYALTIVASARVKAAELAQQIHRGELPPAETPYQQSARERMQEFAPSIARKAPTERVKEPTASEFFNAIDVPSRTLERIK